MAEGSGDVFFLDDFALRQWESGQITVPTETFVRKVHELYSEGKELRDGYAPFCKHVFVPNFTDATAHALPITDQNRHLLRTAYSRRRPDELAVLTRWFPAEAVEAKRADWLDVILYSREQLGKEREALPEKGGSGAATAPWGIISIKPQVSLALVHVTGRERIRRGKVVLEYKDEDYETPMQPITVMRNALGKSEGGSGVPLDKAAYEASIEYWRERATVIAGEPAGE